MEEGNLENGPCDEDSSFHIPLNKNTDGSTDERREKEGETDKKMDEKKKQEEEGKGLYDEDGYLRYSKVHYSNPFESIHGDLAEVYDENEDSYSVTSNSSSLFSVKLPYECETSDDKQLHSHPLLSSDDDLCRPTSACSNESVDPYNYWPTCDSLGPYGFPLVITAMPVGVSSDDDLSRPTSACDFIGRRNSEEASFEFPMNIDTQEAGNYYYSRKQTENGRDGAQAAENESYDGYIILSDEDETDTSEGYKSFTQVMEVSGDVTTQNFLKLTQQRTFVRLNMDEDRECMFFSSRLNVSICYAPGTYATPPIPHGEIIVGMSENPADLPTLLPGQRRISSVLVFVPHAASFSRPISVLFPLLHSDPEPDSIIKVLHSATDVTEETRWQEADVDCLVLDGHINLSIRHFCSYCVIEEKVLVTPQPRHFGTFVYLRKKQLPGMVCVEVTVQLSGKTTGGVTPALGDKSILVRQEAFTLVNSKPLTLKLVLNNIGWQLHHGVKQQVLYETDFPPPSAAVPASRTFNLCIDRDHASADTLDFIIHISQCQGRKVELQIYESLIDIFPQPLQPCPPSAPDCQAGNMRAAPGHLYSEHQHIHPGGSAGHLYSEHQHIHPGGSANPNVQVGAVVAPVSQYPFYQPIHRGPFHSYQQHQEENAIHRPSAGAFDDNARHFPEAHAGVNHPASAAAAQVTGTGGRVLDEASGGSKRVTIPPAASGFNEGHWPKVERNRKESSQHKYQLVNSESSENGGSIPSNEELASSDDRRLESSDAAFVASTMPKLQEVDRVLRSVLSHPEERLAWFVPYEKCQLISDHLDREPGALEILGSQLKVKTAIPEDQDGYSPTVQMLILWMQKRQAENTGDECYPELITALRKMGKQNIIEEIREKTAYEE